MVICFYRFINILQTCSHQHSNTSPSPTYFLSINKISKPILFPLPLFLPSFPSFRFSHSNQVPQLEVKSLAIPPPCFWPRLSPFPSFPPSFLQHLPQHPVSPLLLFLPVFHFICQLLTHNFTCDDDYHLLKYTCILKYYQQHTHKHTRFLFCFFKLVAQTYSF